MIPLLPAHRQEWTRFLASEAAIVGLAWLRENRMPSVRLAGQPHEHSIDLGRQDGFSTALHEIELLRNETTSLPTNRNPTLQMIRPNL